MLFVRLGDLRVSVHFCMQIIVHAVTCRTSFIDRFFKVFFSMEHPIVPMQFHPVDFNSGDTSPSNLLPVLQTYAHAVITTED